MKINKFEAIGIAASIGAMVLALGLLRVENSAKLLSTNEATDLSAAAIVAEGDDTEGGLRVALDQAVNIDGELERLIIDDVVIGSGAEVTEGDTIVVNYVGALQNGQQFDNSYVKGAPFTFTVGEGVVIPGWDRGVLGMQIGGQRVLVVPPAYAYGEDGKGPIPGDATLIFTIELMEIK